MSLGQLFTGVGDWELVGDSIACIVSCSMLPLECKATIGPHAKAQEEHLESVIEQIADA
jgi:hypothetical protein